MIIYVDLLVTWEDFASTQNLRRVWRNLTRLSALVLDMPLLVFEMLLLRLLLLQILAPKLIVTKESFITLIYGWRSAGNWELSHVVSTLPYVFGRLVAITQDIRHWIGRELLRKRNLFLWWLASRRTILLLSLIYLTQKQLSVVLLMLWWLDRKLFWSSISMTLFYNLLLQSWCNFHGHLLLATTHRETATEIRLAVHGQVDVLLFISKVIRYYRSWGTLLCNLLPLSCKFDL